MESYGDFEAVCMKELNKHTPLTECDLTTRDSYITILFEVFMDHILAENIFHESYRVKRTQHSYRLFPPPLFLYQAKVL